eukprot:EG_transcript_1754
MALLTIVCNGVKLNLSQEATLLSKELTQAVASGTFTADVPGLDRRVLTHVTQYLEHYGPRRTEIPPLTKPLPPDGLPASGATKWDLDFLGLVDNGDQLVPLMHAAHKLGVTGLTDLTCAAAAARLRQAGDGGVAVLVQQWGQVPDFTDGEMRQLELERRHFSSPASPVAPTPSAKSTGLAFSVWLNQPERPDSVDPRHDFSVIQRTAVARAYVPDDAAVSCFKCNAAFGRVLGRRHHCRSCGRVFCGPCSSRTYLLPPTRKPIVPPEGPPGGWVPRAVWSSGLEPPQKVRVCDPCYAELELLSRVEMWTAVLEYSGATVPVLWQLCACSRILRTAAMAMLSRLREALYSLPLSRDTHFALLWANREHCRGHSRWVVQLAKSLPHDHWQQPDTVDFMRQALAELMPSPAPAPRRSNCWAMMCSRLCQPRLVLDDAVELLADLCPIPGTHALQILCLDFLDACSDEALRCFLPLFVSLLRHGPDGPLALFLRRRALASLDFANDLYWLLFVTREISNIDVRDKYAEVRSGLKDDLCEKTDLRRPTFRAFKSLLSCLNDLPLPPPDQPGRLPDVLRAAIDANKYFKPDWPLVLPTSPHQRLCTLRPERCRVMASNARPLKLTFTCRDRGAPAPSWRSVHFEEEVTALYKKDDLRVDQIMMGVIRFMREVLRQELADEEGLGDAVLTYNVVPTSSKSGFIEWVPDCKDVYSICRDGLPLQTWIYTQKANATDEVQGVRRRFIHSTAAYTVISYLLGVGDRHKHNFMVTTRGKFFHIDYGYVLGLNPNSLQNSYLRLTTQMQAFIGREEAWNEFLELTVRIFHCLRRHYSVVMRLLMLLTNADPPIANGVYTSQMVQTEILNRFAPDQSDRAASETFLRRLEQDMDQREDTVGDLVHYVSVEQFIPRMLRGTGSLVSAVAYTGLTGVGSVAYKAASLSHQYFTGTTAEPSSSSSSSSRPSTSP